MDVRPITEEYTVKSLLVPMSTIFSGYFLGQFYLVKFGYNSRVGYYSRASTNKDITVIRISSQQKESYFSKTRPKTR